MHYFRLVHAMVRCGFLALVIRRFINCDALGLFQLKYIRITLFYEHVIV